MEEILVSIFKIIDDYNPNGIELNWKYTVVQWSHDFPVGKNNKKIWTELFKAINIEMQTDDILSFAIDLIRLLSIN